MSTIAKEHIPDVSIDKHINNERTVMNEDAWFQPKKCMLINYSVNACENKEKWVNESKFSVLVDNDEIEKEE